MRSIWRTLTADGDLVRDVLALATALGFVGASFGAIAVAAGNPVWVPVLMSLLIFAGGAQFLAIGIVAAGGSLIAAVAGGLLLNLRMLPFGLAIGDVLGRRWPVRLVGSHLLVDESVAFVLARAGDPAGRRRAFWLSGTTLFVVWNVSVVLGALAGTFLEDTEAFGIDAAFPAALLALVLPALRDRDVRLAGLVGAGVAVGTTPFLPPGVPVMLALVGLVTALPPRARERTGDHS